ncbi:MAG: right-handed parallel beta-helix repeat-containing protein [Kiritimatiellales bacterium]|nr:right-handed parallel beta-helix repeat-containing protein [Kiritimatiellales bacterium]
MSFKTLIILLLFCGTSFAEIGLRAFLQQELSAGKKQIVVPKGVYRLSPEHRVHLAFSGVEDTTIDFQGSEIICSEPTRAIDIENCRNLTLINLGIDYDPLPFTQGPITAVGKKFIDVEIHPGYPVENITTTKGEVFDAKTQRLIPGGRTLYDLSRIEPLGGRTFRVHRKTQTKSDDETLGIGNIFVLCVKGGVPHCIQSSGCENLRLEKITVYASNSFAFLETACSNTHYYQCRLTRKTSDPKVGFPRMRSGNADAFHSVGAEKGPTIEECLAEYMGDDCVNIHGHYHIAAQTKGRTATVIMKRELDIQPGDPVEFVEPATGRLLFVANAASIEPLKDYPKEKIEAVKQSFHLLRPDSFRRACSITFDRELPKLNSPASIGATNRTGSGFRVINNDFGRNRSRGIITKASDGEISGNRIEGCFSEALLLEAASYTWMESSYFTNVKIKNNTIGNCRIGHIRKKGVLPPVSVTACRGGLLMQGNQIDFVGEYAIFLKGCADATFAKNSCPNGSKIKQRQLLLENCGEIRVK